MKRQRDGETERWRDVVFPLLHLGPHLHHSVILYFFPKYEEFLFIIVINERQRERDTKKDTQRKGHRESDT